MFDSIKLGFSPEEKVRVDARYMAEKDSHRVAKAEVYLLSRGVMMMHC